MLINLTLLVLAGAVAALFVRARGDGAGRALRVGAALLPAALAWGSLPRSTGGGVRPVMVAVLVVFWALSRLVLVTTEPEGPRRAPTLAEIAAMSAITFLCCVGVQDLILNGVPFPFGVLDLVGAAIFMVAAGVEHRLVRVARAARPLGAPLGWHPLTGPWAWSQQPARLAGLGVGLGAWLLAAAGGVPLSGLAGLIGAAGAQWWWRARWRPVGGDPERVAWAAQTSALWPIPPGVSLPNFRAAAAPDAAEPPADNGFWTPKPGEALPPVIDRREEASRAAAQAQAERGDGRQPRQAPKTISSTPSSGAPHRSRDPYSRG